jgi:hypothetical protein
MPFDAHGDYIKTYRSANAMAQAIISGRGFTTQDSRTYNLCTSAGEDDYVGWLDTTAPVGPLSGKSIWRLTLQPHPWSQEVAELVWEGLESYEVTEETEAPTRRIAKTGWECGLVVEIGY